MAFSRVFLSCSWLTTSAKDWGRYLRAITWYMGGQNARPRVIRGTHAKPLPLLTSGPGGVCSRTLHGARDLTNPMVACGSNRAASRQKGALAYRRIALPPT